MGKLTLLFVAAAVIGGTLLTANVRTSLNETARAHAGDQADVVAREIARNAQSIALSKMVGNGGFQDPGLAAASPLSGGEFDVELMPGWTPEEATVVVRGRYGGAVHEIQSTYRYDPMDAPGPLWLDVPYATGMAGDAQVSGGGRPVYFDRRKHDALGVGSLLPLSGLESTVAANSLGRLAQGVGNRLEVPDASHWAGALLEDLNVNDTEELYQAAEAAFEAGRDTRLLGDQRVTGSVTWGAPDAITVVDGALTVSGAVRGQGALVVKGGLRVDSSATMEWTGLVIVRSDEDVLPIELDGAVTISGAVAVAHEALPPGGHLDVSVYQNTGGMAPSAPWGDVSARRAPWTWGPYPFHQHTHAFDRTPDPSPRGARVYFRERGGAGRHEAETQFHAILQRIGSEEVYLEFGNPQNHGFARVTVEVDGRGGPLVASPRGGFPAGFVNAAIPSRSEPFAASALRHLDVDVRSLRSLRQAFDGPECASWPLCVGTDWGRKDALALRLVRARDGARLYESTLYWHMRTDEVAEHALEEAAWRARIQAGQAFGTRLRLGDRVRLTYTRTPLADLAPTLGFDGNEVALVETAAQHVSPTEAGPTEVGTPTDGGPGGRMVTICHRPGPSGRTITVDEHSMLPAHLAHGDTRGACSRSSGGSGSSGSGGSGSGGSGSGGRR